MNKILLFKNAEGVTEKAWESIKKKFRWDSRLFDFNNQEELGEILKLVKSHYNSVDESYSEYFQWEYRENPAGKAIIWTARHNNEIVGQYVVNMAKIKIDNQTLLGSLSIKTLTRSDFRGKGIHIHLAQKTFETCKANNVVFTYGFPNKTVYDACIERLGFVDIGRVPLLVKLINTDNLFKRYIRNRPIERILSGLIPPILNLFNFFISIKNEREKRLFIFKGVSLKEIGHFDERIDAFWEAVKIKHKNLMVRNKDFLNWRYCNNPRRKYRIVIAEDNNSNIMAYIVLRISTVDNVKVGFIVDILSREDELSNRAASLLITNSFNYFRKNEVMIADCLMLKNNIYFKLLKRQGFVVCPKSFEPQPFPFVIKTHADKVSNNIFNLNNWFVTLGDYDVV